MSRRQSSRPFIVCSLIVHFIVALLLMRIESEHHRSLTLDDSIVLEIAHLPRPEIRPPRRVEPKPPLPSAEPVKTPEKVSVPKPKPGAASDWLAVDALETDLRTTSTARVNSHNTAASVRAAPQSRLSTAIRPASQAISIANAEPPRSGSKAVLPPAEHDNIDIIDGEDDLTANSPDVGVAKLRVGRRRGEALGGMPIGNTSGGGSSSGTRGGENYIQMMTDLARGITDAATGREIDLVFIIDKTGSMEDNVRGIRAYVDLFFEHFTRSGYDVAFGLVTFADATRDKPKVRGVTANHGKFKNWLYKVKFEGGGDLAESGLDALMAALNQTKFRSDTQRFFILVSDGAFHDADYDGRSKYSLDGVIEALQREHIRVDVIGLDFLPIKQIAWATRATWRHIPGKGYLEHIPPTLTAKMLSELGTLGFSGTNPGADELVVYVRRVPRPTWLKITWKVLNPLGERCYGPFTEHVDISNDDSEVVRFTPAIDMSQFLTISGTYTIVYSLENDLGHQSILRRIIERDK